MDIKTVIGDYEAFLMSLVRKTNNHGIEIRDYPMDHLCYRVATVGEYQKAKSDLMAFSSEVAITVHNGREFSIFKLAQPLVVEDYRVPLVELPSPAEDKPYTTGLEHAEVVVGTSFQEFCKANESHLLFDNDMQAMNATARIAFEDGSTIKFHAIPLDEAVRLQGNSFKSI